jgi:ketosteroid isomerase-like protein
MTTDSKAADLWHAMAGAVQDGELDKARALVTEDFEWQVMGRFPYAGRYRGVEGLTALLKGVRDGSGGTFRLAPELSFGNDAAAVVVGRVTATRPGKTLDGENVFIVKCRDGLVASGITIPVDQYAYDEFWS